MRRNRAIGLLVLLLLISGCSASKRAQNRINWVRVHAPLEIAKYCASTAIVDTIVRKGDTITIRDSVSIDCDTVVRTDTIKKNNTVEIVRTHKITVPCPPVQYTVDTFLVRSVDTNGRYYQEKTITLQNVEIIRMQEKIKTRNKAIAILSALLAVLAGLCMAIRKI